MRQHVYIYIHACVCVSYTCTYSLEKTRLKKGKKNTTKYQTYALHALNHCSRDDGRVLEACLRNKFKNDLVVFGVRTIIYSDSCAELFMQFFAMFSIGRTEKIIIMEISFYIRAASEQRNTNVYTHAIDFQSKLSVYTRRAFYIILSVC